MIQDRKCWVYDIETLKGCFTYSAINIDTKEVVQYVLHGDRNDLSALYLHLYDCKGHIGYNNVAFDYPVIHYMMKCANVLMYCSSLGALDMVYNESQRVINAKDNGNPFGASIRPNEVIIPQLDLFKLWHFNNKARSQSLKGLEVAMGYYNVQEMPFKHNKGDISASDIKEILDYNLNDVKATLAFYERSIDKINLRKGLRAKYGLNCTNYPDSKIGEELVLKLYCESTGANPYEIKKMRTERSRIVVDECIFDYINFITFEFNELLGRFRAHTIEPKDLAEKDKSKKKKLGSCIYKGFQYDFGLGGIHGCIEPGVYESNDEWVIKDADVASLYPRIATVNKLYPEHLGEAFCEVYENGIVNPRVAAKKAGDVVMADGLKLSANSVYGKSNDKHSFLYDPLYTMKTTINGQLMISMLCEALVFNMGSDIQMLQVNTDGLTVRIKRKRLTDYSMICAYWEAKTKLELEYVDYSKMIIRDVNNYIAVKVNADISKYEKDGKSIKGVKYKGAFECTKDYHKDNSFSIIPFALSEYFVKGTPVETTIRTHTNIYDFCGRKKFKGDDYGCTTTVLNSFVGPSLKYDIQQKVTRYYISNKGASFSKYYEDGTYESIHKGYSVTIFNRYEERDPFIDYDINYGFYKKECNKEIYLINSGQAVLEFD